MSLEEVIEKNISYDCDGGKKCPHCKRWIKEPHYWLYHKWTLANVIAKYKHYPEIFVEKIEELLDEIEVSGDAKKDSKYITERLEQLT